MNLPARVAPLVLMLALAAGLSACGSIAQPAAPAVRSPGTAGTSGPPGASGPSGGSGVASGGPVAPVAGTAHIPAAAERLTCPAPAAPGVISGLHPAAGQAIPAGFTPVAVVECINPAQASPGHGAGRADRKFVALTGLGGLTTALRAAEAKGNPTGPVCLSLPATPWFVLIGQDGQVIRPLLPKLQCGNTTDPVAALLKALTWISLGFSVAPVPS